MKRRIAELGVAALLVLAAGVHWGLGPWLAGSGDDSLDSPVGEVRLAGLAAPVSLRRDAYGVSLVEAASEEDLAFATGYVMAQDRLHQMVTMARVSQGRLAESAGAAAAPLDLYIRTLGLPRAAEAHWHAADGDVQRLLQRFADGVNAWVDAHAGRLPLEFRLAGEVPESWTPLDSMGIYLLLNLGLSLNLHEELAFLQVAQAVGAERAAWLFPVMPDEPLPLDEARVKFSGVDLAGLPAGTGAALPEAFAALGLPRGNAASNNWAIAPALTRGGASVLANDTHLLLSQPSPWMLLQLRAPGYNATGVALPGLPGIVAGYNGRIAWGMTMVMADAQDLYIERLETRNGREMYLDGNRWRPVVQRLETFRVRGQDKPVDVSIRATRNGPLLNTVLRMNKVSDLQAVSFPHKPGFGIALRWSGLEPDDTLAALFALARAEDFADAQYAAQQVRGIHLNLLYADRANIGWQVTGRYPLRTGGTGKLPSPGWTDDYAWQGWASPSRLPAQVNPPEGFIGTANNRTVPADFPVLLSRSWYAPERGERIAQMIRARKDHDAASSIAMQADQRTLLWPKLKAQWQEPLLAGQLAAAIETLPAREQLPVRELLERLLAWDGDMAADNPEAAAFGVFQARFPQVLYLDELGGDAGAPAFRALAEVATFAYSAAQDHLLGREDSPFWDDVATPQRETRAEIIVRALADTRRALVAAQGEDVAQWRWGALHTYTWRSGPTQFAPHLGLVEGYVARRLGEQLDRGPYPAGGDGNTLNITGFVPGVSLDTLLVPAMRLVVDFALDEPVHLVNAGGQSGNPASPHYDDGIALYLSGDNRVIPFNDSAARHAHFADELRLLPASP